MSDDPLPGATSAGSLHGLEKWRDHDRAHAVFWVAPAGSTAVLRIDGDAAGAVELRWSVLSAEVPSTRAVVLLDGPGSGEPGADFTATHVVAEDVARLVGDRSGIEAGPVEILVFRPDADHAPWPEPSPTAHGVEFRFRHRGGADVLLTLTIPDQPGEA